MGRGSYAAYPPPYKARTEEHSGFNATKMLTRKIYADEQPGRPLPTNDWWTDLLNNQFSGAMWSLPAMVKTSEEGVTVAYPTHWNDNGTEVKPDSWLRVGGVRYVAREARAADWHDWDVVMDLPAVEGSGNIRVTMAHGMPFTWFEFRDVKPLLSFSAAPDTLKTASSDLLLKIGNDLYGLYCGDNWISVALLPDESDFDMFRPYAASVVRSTEVAWRYDEVSSLLSTSWTVKAENLRTPGAAAPVMQGFLPHVYKHAATSDISYSSTSYLTPRGILKMATSANNTFAYSYRFAGMLPYYAAGSDYDPAIMHSLIEAYANGGGFGDDTYWGGKGLTQMALNMTFAKETGETELYERSKSKLRDVMVDWLTYTPGENTKFFAYYPRWGGMLGFDVSYDSDAFNDHHFHYGYYLYAAALLCLEDADFAEGYGEILTMIAKDYANWDRGDTRFPFLRTLDPWVGHSYAGGLGDHGNDNGNGQESSSEAMQGWGGVYLLGIALGNKEMRDCGIFGWLTESRGVVEYWFDRDHIHAGKDHNYDYTLYKSPYNTNITSKGIGWWTWFSGDPLWMHSIQWMPVSPCLNYLSEDLDFVKWDYETMMDGTAYKWFDKVGDNAPLGDQSVGNVVLSYMERYAPKEAARIFDEAWQRGLGIAKGIDTGHISYFVIQSHLTHGDIDFSVSADCPTANAYRRPDGSMSYMVFNPKSADRTVTFRRDGEALISVKAPGRKLTVFTSAPVPSELRLISEKGVILPAGTESKLIAKVLDQYGAETGDDVTFSVSGPATVSDSMLKISAGAAKNAKVTVTAKCGALSTSETVTVNDIPRIVSARIEGLPDFVEIGTTCRFELITTDQYGTESRFVPEWRINDEVIHGSEYTFTRRGKWTVSCEYCMAELSVIPILSNVAVGAKATSSSEENAGTLTANGVDGNSSTRWGSNHTDTEWYSIDLGKEYKISSVTINWEAAYAADYDVAVSDDGSRWTTIVEQRGLSHAGKVRHPVAASGRHVRLNCLRRATQYGYSFYEFEIGGMAGDTPNDATIGIDIEAPALMKEGESVRLGAKSVSLDGKSEAVSVVWSSEPAGEFKDDMFTPLTYGLHTITATAGTLKASQTVLVEEATKLAGLTASPSHLALVTGESAYIDVEATDQFGGVFPIDAGSLDVEITPYGAIFNQVSGEFHADVAGSYVINFGNMAEVTADVRDINGANLALGRRASATSAENGGLTADKAVDGDLSTRWGSQFFDDQAITVDLGNVYLINNIKIYWNSPAYATDYSVMTSCDGELFTSAVVRSGHAGGLDDVILSPVQARYVRVIGHKRSTQYGTSIDELEVYGSKPVSGIFEVSGDKFTEADELYDLSGRRISKPLKGIYVRNGRKIIN